jgi:hypothetical protein
LQLRLFQDIAARVSPRFTQLRQTVWASLTATSPSYPGHRHDSFNLPRREWDAIACATSLSTLSMRRKSAHQMTNYAANRRRKRKGTMTSRGYLRRFLRCRLWRPGTFCKACRISGRTLKPHLEKKKPSDVGKRRKVP